MKPYLHNTALAAIMHSVTQQVIMARLSANVLQQADCIQTALVRIFVVFKGLCSLDKDYNNSLILPTLKCTFKNSISLTNSKNDLLIKMMTIQESNSTSPT